MSNENGNGTLVDPPDNNPTEIVACLSRLEQAFRDQYRVQSQLVNKHERTIHGDEKTVGLVEKVRNLQAHSKKVKWIAGVVIAAAVPLIVTAIMKLILRVDV